MLKRQTGHFLLALLAAAGVAASVAGGGGAGTALAQTAGTTTPTPAPSATSAPSPTPERDWDVPNGHYYTQAGAAQGGFTIADDDGMRFWTAYQRLGGPRLLGYPASRRYSTGGFTYQATQAALLQWQPDTDVAVLGNTFELLQAQGKDDWLAQAKGIPRPIADDGSRNYAEAVSIRLGWLAEPAIKERYLANPNPQAFRTWTESDAIQLYGLPMSRPERNGPFIAQRFQRVAFQLWVDALPGMPPPGSVTPVLGGDLMKEAGIISGTAATPHSAAALVARPVALGATPFPTAVSFDPTITPTFTAPQVQTQTAAAARSTGTALALTPTPPPQGTPSVVATARPATLQVVDGTLSEYSISLPQLTAKPGTVRFSVTNVGVMRHNLHIAGNGVDRKTADLRGGQSGRVDVTFVEPGSYTVYCDLADHADLGMSVTFTIEG